MDNDNKKRKKPGRKQTLNPMVHKYSVRMNAVENDRFQSLLRKSGQKTNTDFIKAMIFDKEMKVVFIDKVSKDYFMRLTNIYEQYRHIGVNYNQIVKALKVNFAEKRALAMLYRLEKMTIELIGISKEILELTQEYENKYLNK